MFELLGRYYRWSCLFVLTACDFSSFRIEIAAPFPVVFYFPRCANLYTKDRRERGRESTPSPTTMLYLSYFDHPHHGTGAAGIVPPNMNRMHDLYTGCQPGSGCSIRAAGLSEAMTHSP